MVYAAQLDKQAARKKARARAPSPDQFAQSKMRAEIVSPYKQNWILAISIAIGESVPGIMHFPALSSPKEYLAAKGGDRESFLTFPPLYTESDDVWFLPLSPTLRPFVACCDAAMPFCSAGASGRCGIHQIESRHSGRIHNHVPGGALSLLSSAFCLPLPNVYQPTRAQAQEPWSRFRPEISI